MKRILNRDEIISNLKEALKELEEILEVIDDGELGIKDEDLQWRFEHAYLHINFAWNARFERRTFHEDFTTEEYNRVIQFPANFEFGTISD